MQAWNANDSFQESASLLVFLNLYALKPVYAYNTGKANGQNIYMSVTIDV